jgi:hypothetical protein
MANAPPTVRQLIALRFTDNAKASTNNTATPSKLIIELPYYFYSS